MTKSSIPVYICDEHNTAFSIWKSAQCRGHLSEPLDLFHVDAHADMGQAEKFSKSLYFDGPSAEECIRYYDDFARRELNIGNFILPAVLAGVVRNIYFIFPEWRNFRPRRKKMTICSAFGEGRIIKYSIPDKKGEDSRIRKAFPDLRAFSYVLRRSENVPKSRHVILDIDMDYFACVDSIYNHMHYELEITLEQFERKDSFQQDASLPFSGLNFDFLQKRNRYFVRIGHKKSEEIAYLPDRNEIAGRISGLVKDFMERDVRPALITLCRSHISGFCPPEYGKFIETRLLEELKRDYSLGPIQHAKRIKNLSSAG